MWKLGWPMSLILLVQETVPLATMTVVLISLDRPLVPTMSLLTLSAPIHLMRASLLQSKFDTNLLVYLEGAPY